MDAFDIREHRVQHPSTPAHHVMSGPKSSSPGYLSAWFGDTKTVPEGDSQVSDSISTDLKEPVDEPKTLTGFKNPWPSWHKPNREQVWKSLEWGEDTDPCIDLAAAGLSDSETIDSRNKTMSRSQQAAKLLQVEKPDFSFNPNEERFKVTWLGHAGVLLQLPPHTAGGRPIRCLFDPFFSMRCSPSQYFGPLRTYPAPCDVSDLPDIDVVMISHDHYDHLDHSTISSLWKFNKASIRFVVPMRNAAWFSTCGVPADRVTELDWWDSVQLLLPRTDSVILRITCTPSQHNSGRDGADPFSTLWSSWYVESTSVSPCRVFFAGDTGYQFHESLSWPPFPGRSGDNSEQTQSEDVEGNWPTCPAFKDIAQSLGTPHLLILPIAVGATFDYIRHLIPLPNSFNPIPRHRPGVTGANHMPPWDAVRVLRLMTEEADPDFAPIAMAMHWGTFVSDPAEILKTLGQLESACQQQGVRFSRSLPTNTESNRCFIALNHGQSIAPSKTITSFTSREV